MVKGTAEMRMNLKVKIAFFASLLALTGLGFLFLAPTRAFAAHFFGSSPAYVRVVVQDPGGSRIGNASINLWIAPVTSPRFCSYAGQNGNFGASHQGSGIYFFMNGPSELQICCNAGGVAGVSLNNNSPTFYESNAMRLSISAPGFQSINNANLDSFSPGTLATNGATTTYTVTLTPSTGSIQGFKVLMPGFSTPNPPSAQPVLLDGGSSITNNPFGTGLGWGAVSAGNHTVSTSAPAGYVVIGSTVCTNTTTCHTEPLSSNPAFASGSSRVVNVPAGGGLDWRWYFVRLPTCSPASQNVTTGSNASLTASFGYNGYSWSASGGTPSSGSGGSFNVSYATTGAKTITVTSWGLSANCTVNVSAPAQVAYRIFNDTDGDGLYEPANGEDFWSGLPFNSSVASIERNTSLGTINTTAATTNTGQYGPIFSATGFSNNQFHVIPASGWQLTNYSSSFNLNGLPTCNASTTCTYSSGWTRVWTSVAAQTWTAYLGVRQVAQNTLNVNSNPTGIAMTSTIAGFGGTTNYTRTSASTINGRIDGPASYTIGSVTYNFSSVAGCMNSSGPDTNNDRFCDVYVTGGGTLTVTFTYVATQPDLVIRNITAGTSPAINGPTTVICGTSNTYQAETRNIGIANSGASTTRASTTGSTNNSDDIAVVALNVNTSSSDHSFTTSWASAGTYTITFTADVLGVVAESNESNNSASINVTVTCEPDLVIRNSVDGTSPAISGPTAVICQSSNTYQARTRNIGPGSAAASTSRATTSGSTNNSDDIPIGLLATNTSSSVYSFITSWNAAGTYTVTFSADIFSTVSESNEGNNTASITVTVTCPPDLVIRNSADGTSPAIDGPTNVTCQTDYTYSARTRNLGPGSAAASITRATTTGSTNNSDDFAVGALTANTVSALPAHSFTTSWNAAGTYQVIFTADANNTVTELSNLNNFGFIDVTVVCLPDLQVNSISTFPPNVSVGQTMDIQANIVNLGNLNITGTLFYNRLRVSINGGSWTTVLPDSSTLNNLNTGPFNGQTTTWISYQPLSAGDYDFEACADTSDSAPNHNRINEGLFEGNNCLVLANISVAPYQPWLRTIDGNVGSAYASGDSIVASWARPAPNACPGTVLSCNSTKMIIAARTITDTTFKSAKGWLLTNYTPNLGTYRDYNSFNKDFSAGACPRGVAPLALNTLPNAKGRFTYSTSVNWTGALDSTVCDAFNSSKESAIVFINGNLTINTNLTTLTRPTVFIVSGNVTIASGAQTVNGMFVVDGSFNTGNSATQLIINGSVAAALGTGTPPLGWCTVNSGHCLSLNDRTYGGVSGNQPAIDINFEPKYLYLLTSFLGNSDSTFEETSP